MCGPLIGPGHTGGRVLRRANHGVLLSGFYRLTCGRTGGLRNRPVRDRSSSCPTGASGRSAQLVPSGACRGRSAVWSGPVAGRGVVARSRGRMVWTGSGPRGVRASVVGGGRTSRQRQLVGSRADQSHRQGGGRGVRGDSRHKYKCFMRCSGWFREYLLACSACVSQSEDQNRSHPALASVHLMSTQVGGLGSGTTRGALRSDPQIATEPGASPAGVVNRPPSWRRRRLFVLVRHRPASRTLRAGRQASGPGPVSDPHRQLLTRLPCGRRPPRAGRVAPIRYCGPGGRVGRCVQERARRPGGLVRVPDRRPLRASAGTRWQG